MVTWDNVVKALENDKYVWRTIRGVAKELNTTEEEIKKLIQEHISEVIKSSIPAETGEDLFTTRKHYRQKATFIDRVASVATSSPLSISSSVFGKKEKTND